MARPQCDDTPPCLAIQKLSITKEEQSNKANPLGTRRTSLGTYGNMIEIQEFFFFKIQFSLLAKQLS